MSHTSNIKPLRVGIITPVTTGPLKSFIDYSLHFLPLYLHKTVEQTYFTKPVTPSNFDEFARCIKEENFDLLWGLTLMPAIYLQRLRDEYGIQTPMLSCSSMSSPPNHSREHFCTLEHPDVSQATSDFLSTYCAPLKKIVICGRSSLLSVSTPIINLKKQLERAGVSVAFLATDTESQPYDAFMRTDGKGAQALFITPDAVALAQTSTLIACAHAHQCAVFSSEVGALAYNIDGVIGFDVKEIAEEAAKALVHTLHKRQSFSSSFTSPQRVYLPINSRLRSDRIDAITHILPPTHQLLLLHSPHTPHQQTQQGAV